MIQNIKRTALFILSLVFMNCGNAEKDAEENNNVVTAAPVKTVLTADQQRDLTPDAVVTLLKEGNQRFMDNDLTSRDHSAQVRKSALGQYPKAIILSCIDSRVPVEDVFDMGIGDLFVARVAGNFENTDILGSMEFACAASGSRLVVVLGHESCGAVVNAIRDTRMGNITAMLANIKPAIDSVIDFTGDRVAENPAFVHEVCVSNIQNTISDIRSKSPILKKLEDSIPNRLKIVGAVYNIETGKVEFME